MTGIPQIIQTATGEHGLPKSSLDGARETVLEQELPGTFRKDLHIRIPEPVENSCDRKAEIC